MCDKCNKSKCTGCEGQDVAQLQNAVSEMQDIINALAESVKIFTCGHPILLVEHADDVASFDLETGKGSDCWEGWAMCDGRTQKDSKNKNVKTPDFRDKFIIAAGGSYAVDETGGEAEHTLLLSEIPAHNHALTDPGHGHAVTDPGHGHAVTDPGHNHTQDPHAHSYTDHSIQFPGSPGVPIEPGFSEFSVPNDTLDTAETTAVNNDNTTGLTVNENVTDISVSENVTGISIADAGESEAHNNMPPYIAAFYVIRIG